MNHPVPSTYAEVAAILRNMADLVADGDSFEGSIEYLIPEMEGQAWDVSDVPEVLVRASYRIGNSMGQGGIRIIGEIGE